MTRRYLILILAITASILLLACGGARDEKPAYGATEAEVWENTETTEEFLVIESTAAEADIATEHEVEQHENAETDVEKVTEPHDRVEHTSQIEDEVPKTESESTLPDDNCSDNKDNEEDWGGGFVPA